MTSLHYLRLGLVLTSVISCKKPGTTESTNPDSATLASADQQDSEDSTPQLPDPPELAAAERAYFLGEYQHAIDTLSPVYDDLKTRDQYGASGRAAVWLALAHAEQVFENGKEPAQWATSMAERTHDEQLKAMAQLASSAIDLGNQDFGNAADTITGAVERLDSTMASLAHVMLAEALIGAAFGGNDSDSLEHPEYLDRARKAYARAGDRAKGSPYEDALQGRIEEGYAALADYRKDGGEVCKHVAQASSAFARSGATALAEGPMQLGKTYNCEPPGGGQR